MKRTAALAALFVVTLGSMARAERNPPPPKLFDDDLARAEGSKEGRAALEEVASRCGFSPFSRVGPRPEQIEGCEKSVERAVSVGPSVVPHALRKLNDRSFAFGARNRTYDVLARIGDVRTLESLVLALEKADEDRQDRDLILSTLARISHAKIGEPADPSSPPDFGAVNAAWRSWLAGHRGMSRTQLLEERFASERARIGDPKVETALDAANFLAEHKETRTEGLAALESLRRRPDVPAGQAASIRNLILSIEPPPKAAPAKKERSPAPKEPAEKPQNAPPPSKLRSLS